MIKKVKVDKIINAGDFLKFAAVEQKKRLLKLARVLAGKKILHLNATAAGGGVAEILRSLVPYLRALGIQNDWYVIDSAKAGKKFFDFTNKLHNALQGASIKFSSKDWQVYEKVNKQIAEDLKNLDYDILVINDPQPLFSVKYLHNKKPKIYFSHIDTSAAYKKAWDKVLPIIKQYDRIIFSNKDFAHGSLPKNKVKIFTPAIDPLAPKQKIVPQNTARKYLKKFGIPKNCPLIVQVSRFDIWKNPLGVIEAFRLVQQTYPEVRLALVGFSEAKDNPEADKVYRDVAAVAKRAPNIYLFFHPGGINISEFTTMAQNAADVVVQNSIKEGFGLVVTEAMWKGKPVIGGPASGIRKQIKNGKNGFIVETSEALANQIMNLLKYPKKRKKIGLAGKNSAARNFLFPRLIMDHLKIYEKMVQ